MAVQGDVGTKEEVKTQFSTVEGVYKVVPLSEYSRPNRLAYNNAGSVGTSPPVRVSFVSLPETSGSVNSINDDRTKICFNYGRELYVYSYRGLRKAVDLCKPLEKRSYNKEEVPTSHDFNSITAGAIGDRGGRGVALLVGLLGGQVQLIDPITKEVNKAYNSSERLIDKSKVTCVRWVPGSINQFLCSHQSGNMYLYNEELVCAVDRPHYQLFKQGDGYSIYTCKTKTTRNPLYRWNIGDTAINEFAFSPCSKYLGVVSQDGFLRVFNFDTMDLVGSCRSYYGGLICVCWSPDGRYVVCGGEDDLLTIWSFSEKRVVARGAGHKSWVTVVAFDPYTTLYGELDGVVDIHNDDSYNRSNCNYNSTERGGKCRNKPVVPISRPNSIVSDGMNATCYRLGSVGQDTLLCLWDLKDDYLRQSYYRPRSSTVVSGAGVVGVGSNSAGNSNAVNSTGGSGSAATNSISNSAKSSSTNHTKDDTINTSFSSHHALSANSLTAKLASLNFGDKRSSSDKNDKDHKRSLSLAGRNSCSNLNKKDGSRGNSSGNNTSSSSMATSGAGSETTCHGSIASSKYSVGTPQCPRMDECPLLEPMVCKKIAHERLTGLVFREDCIVTVCQDGCIHTWCRPGKQGVLHQHSSPSPSSACMSQLPAGGTVV